MDRRGLRPSVWALMGHAWYHQRLSLEKRKETRAGLGRKGGESRLGGLLVI